MSDIDIGGAILLFFAIYCGLNILLGSLGSFGLYRMLEAKKNPSAKTISVMAFIFSLVVSIGGLFAGAVNGFEVILLFMFAYAVFGLTCWMNHRKAS